MLPLARHRSSTRPFPGIPDQERPCAFQNFHFAFLQYILFSLLLVLVLSFSR